MTNTLLEKAVELLEEATTSEDIDSNDYGQYCHFCGVDAAETEEWQEVQKYNYKLLTDAGAYSDDPSHFRTAFNNVKDQLRQCKGPMRWYDHTPDCWYVRVRAFLEGQK